MSKRKIKVQPGKTQSKIGFIVGIVFVLIGCVIVIPIFGVFGVLWTAVAGMIAYTHYKNGFSDEGVATHEIIIEDGMDISGNPACEEDVEAKLKKLNSLYEQGLITKEEYDEMRKKVLDELC